MDQEVKRILDEAHDRARVVLEEHNDLLERIATALLERETLDREQIETLERGDDLPPMPEPPPVQGVPDKQAELPAAAPRPNPLAAAGW